MHVSRKTRIFIVDMAIWQCQDQSSSIIEPKFVVHGWESLRHCWYCGSKLKNYPVEDDFSHESNSSFLMAWACNDCGWWFFERSVYGNVIHGTFGDKFYENEYGHRHYSRGGSLKELDLSDISLPLGDIRSY